MLKMTDISGGQTAQAQWQWQMDFVQPLITLEEAQIASQGLMGKLMNGGEVTGSDWSGANAAIGQSAPGFASGAISTVAPADALGAPIAIAGAGP
jgi:hypothetical protein